MPVPAICEMSTLCSFAIFRTTGDDRWRRPCSAPVDLGRARGDGRGCGGRWTRRFRSVRGWRCVAEPLGLRRSGSGRRSAGGRRRRRGRLRLWRLGRGAGLADDRDDAVDRNGFALFGPDFGDDAGHGRRNLRIDLVGRNLEQRLITFDRVADLLDPAHDRAFRDRLAHLRHHDIGSHRTASFVQEWIAPPCTACAASPTASAMVGCA